MSTPASHLLAGLVLDAGGKATAVLLAGFGADLALRHRSAAARHAMWATTLLALPLLAPAALGARGPALAIEATWLAAIWATGVCVVLTPLVAGRLWLGRVARRGEAHGDLIQARPGDVAGPLTFGWWRPRVVVPADWDRWDPHHRAAALAHEAAHISRRDWAVHTASWVVCALLWFHPLVWAARRRLAAAAELAADDLALAAGLRPSDYAAALLHLSRRSPAPAGLAASSGAEPRIRAVLAQRPRSARRGPAVLAATGALLLVLPALAAVPLWSPPLQPPACLPEASPPVPGALP